MLLVTKNGKERIRAELQRLEGDFRKFIARNKRDSNLISGELGSGVMLDGCEYRERVLRRLIVEKKADLDQCSVVDPPVQTQKLAIHHIVTLRLYEDDGERDVTFELGGYGDSDPSATPEVISYDGALTRDLYGHKVGSGAVAKLKRGGVNVEVEVEIVSISLSARILEAANAA